MKKNFLRGLRFSTGIALILLGLIGLVIPILQGWILIFAGIFLINPNLAIRLKEKVKGWWSRQKSE